MTYDSVQEKPLLLLRKARIGPELGIHRTRQDEVDSVRSSVLVNTEVQDLHLGEIPNRFQIQSQTSDNPVLSRRIRIQYRPSRHGSLTNSRRGETDTTFPSTSHILLRMLSQQQIRKETYHPNLLDTLEIYFFQRRSGEWFPSAVDNMIYIRTNCVEELDNVFLNCVFISEVANMPRDSGRG